MFAIVWAWMTFVWFASSYDTDDWGFRIATLVQMLGVTVLALGIGDIFHGFEEGHLDNRVVVAGYVIMRVSQISLYLRAARNDPEHRPVLLGYTKVIGVAQVGWIATAIVPLPLVALLVLMGVLYVLEVGGSALVESRVGRMPLHVHHLAERYGLLGIITFGEVVLGTTTAVSALTEETGWTVDAAVLAFAGIAMVVGMWWVYFGIPHGEILARRRDLALRWSYGHLVLYSAIAATGAGLHTVAYYLEHHSELGEVATTLTVAVPLGIYVLAIYGLYHLLLPGRDLLHVVLISATVLALAGAVGLAFLHVSIAWPVLALTLTPWITVLGYEMAGHAKMDERVESLS